MLTYTMEWHQHVKLFIPSIFKSKKNKKLRDAQLTSPFVINIFKLMIDEN